MSFRILRVLLLSVGTCLLIVACSSCSRNTLYAPNYSASVFRTITEGMSQDAVLQKLGLPLRATVYPLITGNQIESIRLNELAIRQAGRRAGTFLALDYSVQRDSHRDYTVNSIYISNGQVIRIITAKIGD